MRDGSTRVTSIAPLLSLAIYLAAVAPPAPPPITTTFGFPPFAITIGADKLAVTAAAVCINERLFIDIFFPPLFIWDKPRASLKAFSHTI